MEFLVSDEKKLEPLKKELKDRGFKMGGIGPHIQMLYIHRDGFTATAHVQTHQALLRQ